MARLGSDSKPLHLTNSPGCPDILLGAFLATIFTDSFFSFWSCHVNGQFLEADFTTEFDLVAPCWHSIRANVTTHTVFTKAS